MTQAARPDAGFWRDRRILLTGHTGFKGAWAALWLTHLGAEVHGFALPPDSDPNLWAELGDGLLAGETLADLADRWALREAVARARPQIVLHFAAQALVREGYADPVKTVATNVLGTAHLLEAVRGAADLEAVLLVTTDKVYADGGTGREFVEDDRLGGRDPYSASKAATELVAAGFAASYFEPAGIPVATARAGNVIGGGDWSADRLVPDLWRAARDGEPARLRAPRAVRPWQHVLEPLCGYLLYVEAMLGRDDVPRALNFGPAAGPRLTVGELAELVGRGLGVETPWMPDEREHPPETQFLALDSSLARERIGWEPRLDALQAAEWTAAWYAQHSRGSNARSLCLEQIRRYEACRTRELRCA